VESIRPARTTFVSLWEPYSGSKSLTPPLLLAMQSGREYELAAPMPEAMHG